MSESPAASREQYDQLWSKEWANLHAGGPLARTRYRLALRYLGLGPASRGRLLDVGAGNGAFLALANARAPGLEVFGAEFSENAVALAPAALRNRLALCDLQGDAPLPWGGGFNFMTCMEVLEHLPDDARAMSQIAAALAPKGRLLVSVPAWQRKWSSTDAAAGHVRRYEPDALSTVITAAGLHIERMKCWGGPLAWMYLKAAARIGPEKVMSIQPTGFLGVLAASIYHVVKLDDFMSLGAGEQWFVIATKT
jgi:2-polyprenyl-3-methyl-5-hydroxy-6-metoxy-1,4-benzoquinol methylase